MACSGSNPWTCTACSTGFFLYVDQNNSYCQPCPSYCISCSSATTCIYAAFSGYTLMTVNGSTVLGVCDPGCFQCASSNPASCSVCLPGYYIPSTTAVSGVFTCLTCNATCQYCQQNKPNVCLSCYPGAIYNNSTQTCTSCPTNCLACSRQNSSVICTSCPTGYTMNLNSTGCISTSNTSCGQN